MKQKELFTCAIKNNKVQCNVMNTNDLTTTASTLATQSEQSAPAHETGSNGPTAGFFAVGILINIIMVTVYIVWACRHWKKSRDRA